MMPAGVVGDLAHAAVQLGKVLGGAAGKEKSVRTRVVVRVVEGLHRNLQQQLVAVAPRILHPALQAVAGSGEGERHLRRQVVDGALRSRLAEAEAADDQADARAARA
ncbi:hypothetical protein ABIA20_006106 [Sinorhizobium fredii]